MIAGDQARVSVAVAVPLDEAFAIFTEEVDLWWRKGPAWRIAGKRPGTIHFETRLGGRLLESFDTPDGTQLVQSGEITGWEPPHRFSFDWRGINFSPGEKTEVEVTFEPQARGTLVTVTHRGFSKLRDDHPVRHGASPPEFIRTMGMWWAQLLTSLREHVAQRGA